MTHEEAYDEWFRSDDHHVGRKDAFLAGVKWAVEECAKKLDERAHQFDLAANSPRIGPYEAKTNREFRAELSGQAKVFRARFATKEK